MNSCLILSQQWREVDENYQNFKHNLGETNEKFAEYTARATGHLLSLDDILDEIGTIKGVLEYQLCMWNELHAAVGTSAKDSSPDTTTGAGDAERLRQTTLVEKCVWDPNCKPTHFRESFFKQGVFSLADKTEQDAKILREKACCKILTSLASKTSTMC